MPGFDALGLVPIGVVGDFPIPPIALAREGIFVHTVEIIEPVTGAHVLACSTREWATRPTDIVPNHPFHGTLSKPLSHTRTVVSGRAFSGVSASYAEIEIDNWSGDYDDLRSLAGYRILCKGGFLGTSFDTFTILLDGVVRDSHTDFNVLRIEIEDNSARLDIPVQPNIYLGTGGSDGDASSAQKRKPRGFGFLFNTTPTLIDPANDVYQLNDGAILSVDEVRDRGVEITAYGGTLDHSSYAALVSAPVSGGTYITCLAEGLMRLGAQAEQITVDFHGQVDEDGELYRTTAEVVQFLLSERGIALDAGRFTALNALQDGSIGYFIGSDEDKKLGDVVMDILAGADCFGGFRRDGVFDVGRIDTPDEDRISAYYSDLDIIEDSIEKVVLPDNINPPPWRIRVPYAINWTVQADVNEITVPATAAYVATPYKLADPAFDEDVLTLNAKAQDPEPIKAFFAEKPAADAEANRLFALLAGPILDDEERRLFRVTLGLEAMFHNLGDMIFLSHRRRFDLSDGDTFVVVETQDNAADDTCTLTLLQ